MAETFCTFVADLRPHQGHMLTAAATLLHLCSREEAMGFASPEPYTDMALPYTNMAQRSGLCTLIIDNLKTAMTVSRLQCVSVCSLNDYG